MKTKESKDRREQEGKEAQEQSRRTEKQHHHEKQQEEKQAHGEDLPGEKKEIKIEHRENVQAGPSDNREKRKDERPLTEETESFSPEQRKKDTRAVDKEQGREGATTRTEEKEIDVELDVQKDKVEIEASRSSNKTDAPGNEVDVNVSMDKNELHINISMQKPTGKEGNKEKPGKKKKDDTGSKEDKQ